MSARGYNKCIELGNLTADPELKHTSTGTAFATFRIAVTRTYANNGHTQEDTQFLRIVVWGKQAEAAHSYLVKGNKVLVDGRLEIRSYKDPTTNEDRQITEIVCNELVFLGGGRGEPRLGEPGSSVQGDEPPLDEAPPF
jgi:single-strand DNA-binding protein